MTIPVFDPWHVTTDPAMPMLAEALNPAVMQTHLSQLAPTWGIAGQPVLHSIRVLRHKPQRRCLIAYDLILGDRPETSQPLTVLGKVRARGLDRASHHVLASLWHSDFGAANSAACAVPQPMGQLPHLHMVLQRYVPGTVATQLIPRSGGTNLCRRIALAAHQLHQTRVTAHRQHTMADELRILHERLPRVLQQYPHWQGRIERLLAACDRLGASLPPCQPTGIHRDFYSDQILVEGDRLYLLDLDLYCMGDPGLDLGNFIAHLTEYSLRTLGRPDGLAQQERAMAGTFIQLAGEQVWPSIWAYTALTLVRHIYISTLFPQRQAITPTLLALCEERLASSAATAL